MTLIRRNEVFKTQKLCKMDKIAMEKLLKTLIHVVQMRHFGKKN